MNAADGRCNLPLFERAVLAVAKSMIRPAVVLTAWQFRHAKRKLHYFVATLLLRAINLIAGALGALVWAERSFVFDARTSQRPELRVPAYGAAEPVRIVHDVLSGTWRA